MNQTEVKCILQLAEFSSYLLSGKSVCQQAVYTMKEQSVRSTELLSSKRILPISDV